MHYVYLLQSRKDKSLYVGNTNNLEKRLVEHSSGKISYTKSHMPLRLVYYEAYLDRLDALGRENKLKHHGSVIGHLKRRLKRSLAS